MAFRKLPKLDELISQRELRRILDYRKDTGALTWRVDRARTAKAGLDAGCYDRNDYLVITIKGQKFQAQRVVWYYIHGRLPDGRLVFRDKDRRNIAIHNLVEEKHVIKRNAQAAASRAYRARQREQAQWERQQREFNQMTPEQLEQEIERLRQLKAERSAPIAD